MTTGFTESGKIRQSFFAEKIHPFTGSERPEVLAGPAYGVDVSLIRLPGGMAMAMTSDPLSLIPTLGLRESAWLSVHLMANDIATTGKPPQFAQLVLNLPESITEEQFNEYWRYIHHYCNEIGVAITGGHTGKAVGQHSTLAGGGTMVTVAPEEEILLSSFAQPGDVIIVTKDCALVATSILAMSFPGTVKNRCGAFVYQSACDLFYDTSSLSTALCAVNGGVEQEVTAMHDVTEGGVLGAIYEMAMAAGCGAFIDGNALPVGETQQVICGLFAIDPRFCVGAGSMIITAGKNKAVNVMERLALQGVKATIVGNMTEPSQGIVLSENGQDMSLIHPGTDPYWQAFYKALQQGLT